MDGVPRKLNPLEPDEVVEIGRITAKFYEYRATDDSGANQLGIRLEQTINPSGGPSRSQWMACDPDRLEIAVSYGQAIAARLGQNPDGPAAEFNPKTPLAVHRISETLRANYYERDGKNGREILVRLDQDIIRPDGQRSRQGFAQSLDNLADVAKHARNFEKRNGHERLWYSVVEFQGLAGDEGEVEVRVVKWGKWKDAETFADVNWQKHGYALLDTPFRQPLPGKENSLTVARSQVASLQPDIEYYLEEEQRRAPGFILGVWCQHTQEPLARTPVSFDPIGRDETSRRPIDIRVVPKGVERPSGPDEKKPMYVIIELDMENFPPVHRVKEALPSLERGKERIAEIKVLALEQERRQSLEQRGPEEAIDLSKLTIRPPR